MRRLLSVLLEFSVGWGVGEGESFAEILRAPDPRRAAELYLDWCHRTPAGHRLIAEALAEEIEGAA